MRVERLGENHDLSSFDCGIETLNTWLKRFALTNQRSDSAQTYVAHRDGVVIAYYSLTAGSVGRDEAPRRIAKGLAQHPVGVILLARFAVDKSEQGKGLGKSLLRDALSRIMTAAETIGVRAVLVHAVDAKARDFYEHYGFERSPVDELELMLLLKDLRRFLKGEEPGIA